MTNYRHGHGPQTQFISDTLSSWSKGAVTVTGGQTDPFGGTGAYLVDESQTTQIGTAEVAVSYGLNGQKIYGVWFQQGPVSISGVTTSFRINDATATTNRLAFDVNWPSANSPTVAAVVGSLVGTPENYGGNWWRQWARSTTGVVAANANFAQVIPCRTTSGHTGNIMVFRPFTSDANEVFRTTAISGTAPETTPTDTASDHPPYADVPWAVPPTVAPPFTRRP